MQAVSSEICSGAGTLKREWEILTPGGKAQHVWITSEPGEEWGGPAGRTVSPSPSDITNGCLRNNPGRELQDEKLECEDSKSQKSRHRGGAATQRVKAPARAPASHLSAS